MAGSCEGAFITNVRHRDLLARAAAALTRAERGARAGVTEEYLLLDYREALDPYREVCDEFVVFDWSDRPLESTIGDLTAALG